MTWHDVIAHDVADGLSRGGGGCRLHLEAAQLLEHLGRRLDCPCVCTRIRTRMRIRIYLCIYLCVWMSMQMLM